jgi:uncharacterized membrane protein (UPF0127 family)
MPVSAPAAGGKREARVDTTNRALARHLPGLLALLLVSCMNAEGDRLVTASRQSPIIPLDSGVALIETAPDSFTVRVEIAETPDQTEIGLMERDALPDDEGMIFLFGEERGANAGFWMYRTRIPLDIAYLDSDGRIVAIRSMDPCGSPHPAGCAKYPPGVPYWSALEVNRGYFASRGIGVGARITVQRGDADAVGGQ